MEPSMPWTVRQDHARRSVGHSSDLTNREWGLIAPLLSGPRTTNLRNVANAIQYIAATSFQWSLPPRDFPPFATVRAISMTGGTTSFCAPQTTCRSCRATDGGYTGANLRCALKGEGNRRIETIKRSDAVRRSEVLPRRRAVERIFAWLGKCRRMAKGWEVLYYKRRGMAISAF
jgi:transposase